MATNHQEIAVFAEPRIAYHPLVEERFGIDKAGWRALIDAVWPAAKTADAVVLALSYCKARNLDPFKRPVHIVPVWSSEQKRMVESVWPGIGELRTTAFRTGLYAGREATEFGPIKNETLGGVQIEFPEWARVTVYRLGRNGERMPFPGPRVYWLEIYATANRDTAAPNTMWRRRPAGQIDKCAESAALRAAFPEEIGNDYTADEMEGQTIDHAPAKPAPPPPLPRLEDYKPDPTPEETEEPPFVVIDCEGEEHWFQTEGSAKKALEALFTEAAKLGKAALEAARENNEDAFPYARDLYDSFAYEQNPADGPPARAPRVSPQLKDAGPPASPPEGAPTLPGMRESTICDEIPMPLRGGHEDPGTWFKALFMPRAEKITDIADLAYLLANNERHIDAYMASVRPAEAEIARKKIEYLKSVLA